jgi:hypothetical protein
MGLADFVLLHSGELGASTCARPHFATPPVRFAHSSWVLIAIKPN